MLHRCETHNAALALARHLFANATAALRGQRAGLCYVVPCLRGWDARRGAWRRPMCFGDAVGRPGEDRCADAPTLLCRAVEVEEVAAEPAYA